MNFKRIVIAIDLDEKSNETLKQIKSFPFTKESEIHLIHVFEQNYFSFDLIPDVEPSAEDYLLIQKVIEEKISNLKDQLGLQQNNVVVKCLIAPNARQEFLGYADKMGATLIVATSKERSGFSGLFESSFTSFLNKFSRSNLLILRPEK